MAIGFIDKKMFILTDDGFRTWSSLSKDDLVKSFRLGKEELCTADKIAESDEIESEYMVVVNIPRYLKKLGVLFSVSSSQRMFWMKDKSRSLQIGTAKDFYEELTDRGTLYLVKDDNSLILINSSDAHLEPALAGWVVKTEYGNMVVKADGPALKFCDCG